MGGQVLAESAPGLIMLPGLRGEKELASLSRLLGNRKQWQASHSRQGGATYQLHDEPVLTPAEIRGLGTDQGLLLYRNAPPVLLDLPTVWQDKRLKRDVLASMREFDAVVAGTEVPDRYRPPVVGAQLAKSVAQ
jgi:hypothetical protein